MADPRNLEQVWKAHFDKNATSFRGDETRASDFSNSLNQSDIHSALLEGTSLRPGMVVLDAGCGSGTLLSRLWEQGVVVFGFDFSGEMLKLAWAKAELFSPLLCQASAACTPFGDCSFDYVSASEVLQYQ